MTLPLFSALLVCVVPTVVQTWVVSTFFGSPCTTYFYMSHEPRGMARGNATARICQMLDGTPHYASLYDRKKRIPLYSAYIIRLPTHPQPYWKPGEWYIEPQLADPSWPLQMQTMEMTYGSLSGQLNRSEIKQRVLESQATDHDYARLGYSRQRLHPNFLHGTPGELVTFALTYEAPMYNNYNRNIWFLNHVTMLHAKIHSNCTAPTDVFVVTGVVPDSLISARVSLPEFVWTALCCAATGYSIAFFGEGDPLEPDVIEVELTDLESRLSSHYPRHVKVFPGGCP
ncbi:ENDD1 protein, partial [Amia calva]|nr:ENDD1 protein [Amia calva]